MRGNPDGSLSSPSASRAAALFPARGRDLSKSLLPAAFGALGTKSWPADRTAGRGWAQRAPEVAASSDFCDYRYHHRAPSRLLVDGFRDRVVDRLLENVHVRMSVRETLEACHGRGARIGHQPG